MYAVLEDTDMIVIIGTSGNVINVEFLSQYADYSILNNLEFSSIIDDSVFDKVIYDKATIAIDEISDIVNEFLEQ
jgi:NAD-dependent deacetylase